MKVFNHKFNNLKLNEWKCNTLILGTFNPENGPFADFYYGRIRNENNWSNRFWHSLSDYLISIGYIKKKLVPGDLDSKISLMKDLNFNCKDLIKSIESDVEEKLVNGEGFSDTPLMLDSNIIHYNTNFIIKYINEKNIKKIVSSWGKGSSLSKSFKSELLKIKNNCPNTSFKMFSLPPFGRPLMSNLRFGKILFDELNY